MPTRLRRLAECSAAEWVLLAQMAGCALALGVALRLPLRLLPLPRLARVRLGPFPFFHRRHPIERVARLAGMASILSLGRGRCLTRSLLLYWLLRARGEAAVLTIGVAREATPPGAAALDAHAWVETGGRILGDSPAHTARYAPLARV